MIPNWTFIVIIMYFKYKPYKVRLIKKKKKVLIPNAILRMFLTYGLLQLLDNQ